MTTTVWLKLEHIDCGVKGCGVAFGIPSWLHRKMTDEGRLIYCPNGHYIGYTANTVQTLKDQLARERAEHDQTRADRDAHRRAARHQEHRARVLKGHHTRLKKRVAGGVCPCCQRTFQNLAQHMRGQHPGYLTT